MSAESKLLSACRPILAQVAVGPVKGCKCSQCCAARIFKRVDSLLRKNGKALKHDGARFTAHEYESKRKKRK